jgi:protein ImuB
MKEPLYVCVYVPEFPVQALMRLRPELSKLPVVVLEGNPPLEQVCSFNSLARNIGIEKGMSRSDLEGFAGLCILLRSREEERTARIALLEVVGAFTPRVEIQPSSGEEFVIGMDMAGTTRIFGEAPQMAERIALAINTLQIHAKIAVSANLNAARCIAPSARKLPIVILAGQEKECLSQLPLSILNLTPEQAEIFADWGLHKLNDLAAIAEVDLVVRLGQAGKRLRLLALGEHPHFMVPEEPVMALEEFIRFDAPLELLDSLLFVLGPMLDQLLTRAQHRAFALASVTVKLGLDDGGEHLRTIKPALPVMQREILLKLLHLDLQSHPPSAGVLSVFLHAEPGTRSKVQLGLFSPQIPEPLRLDVTIARIAAIVGEDRVGRIKLLDTNYPDRFGMEKFVISTTTVEMAAEPKAVVALRRFRPPIPISIRSTSRRLSAFSFENKWFIVQEAYGPWRKSGEWWSSHVWSREEWDICASANSEEIMICVLSQDLLLRRWHMEALYD